MEPKYTMRYEFDSRKLGAVQSILASGCKESELKNLMDLLSKSNDDAGSKMKTDDFMMTLVYLLKMYAFMHGECRWIKKIVINTKTNVETYMATDVPLQEAGLLETSSGKVVDKNGRMYTKTPDGLLQHTRCYLELKIY